MLANPCVDIIPIDFFMCVHVRKYIYLEICILRHRKVIYTYTLCTYCHMPHMCEDYAYTWAYLLSLPPFIH